MPRIDPADADGGDRHRHVVLEPQRVRIDQPQACAREGADGQAAAVGVERPGAVVLAEVEAAWPLARVSASRRLSTEPLPFSGVVIARIDSSTGVVDVAATAPHPASTTQTRHAKTAWAQPQSVRGQIIVAKA